MNSPIRIVALAAVVAVGWIFESSANAQASPSPAVKTTPAAAQPDNAAFIEQAVARRAEWTALPADRVTPDPDAARFPGAVAAEAPRVADQAVDVPLDPVRWRARNPWWHATGLYAPPGEVVTVRVPATGTGLKLSVRIGAHKDNSNPKAKSFKRTPVDLTKSWPLDRPEVRIANPFGGPIYIEVPRDAGAGAISITISGAVAAPRFVLGETTAAQWALSRQAPAPWAELSSPHVSITVPAERVRGIDDPTALMEFWERGAELVHELSGGEFGAERFVWDPAISAGSMHSGYPIMCQGGLDTIVNLDKLRAGDLWGFFHEMGHNNQYGAWTPKGQVEVTCNWFPMYVRSAGLGLSLHDRDDKYTRPDQPFPRGRIGSQNPGDHFVVLRFWRQVQGQFGWDPFKQVLREFHAPGFQAPKSDEAKWDDLLERFSRATGRDLSPQFVAWGAEVTEAGLERARALHLEPWVHEDAPGQPGTK